VTEPIDQEFLDLAKKRGAVYVPTLIVGENYSRVASQQFAFLPEEMALANPDVLGSLFDLRHFRQEELGRRFRDLLTAPAPPPLRPQPALAPNLVAVFRADISVAMGTDAGNIGTLHGPSIFREMAAMEKAGLQPLEVLHTATLGGARVMGRDKELGRVAEGYLADLLLLDADPSRGTRNLARLHRVVKAGTVLDPATLAPDRPQDVVQRQLNAYNARDLEAFLATYSPTVEIRAIDGSLELKGLTALRKRYGRLFSANPRLHAEVARRMVLGHRIVDEERVTGATPTPLHAARVYEVKGNRISKVWLVSESPADLASAERHL
jgi:hypothetical protein